MAGRLDPGLLRELAQLLALHRRKDTHRMSTPADRTAPDPVDRILAERRARQAAVARNRELSAAAWEMECAERAAYEAEVRR